jgi:hypothetical protein
MIVQVTIPDDLMQQAAEVA